MSPIPPRSLARSRFLATSFCIGPSLHASLSLPLLPVRDSRAVMHNRLNGGRRIALARLLFC